MRLHHYKTSWRYGTIRVPPPLQLAVRHSLQLRPRTYVFARATDQRAPWTAKFSVKRMASVHPHKRPSVSLIIQRRP